MTLNFKNIKTLDKDIDANLIENYQKTSNKAQRIHVLGNHWPLINKLRHRKFSFFSKKIKDMDKIKDPDKNSICITDVINFVEKINNKLIITQGYSKDYNMKSVDYLLVQKKFIDESYDVSIDQISEKGFLVIDLNTGEMFYTE